MAEGKRRAPRKRRIRAGVRRRKSFGPIDVNLTHKGVSSVTIDPPGPGSYNTRTGDISLRGPLGGWLKIATGVKGEGLSVPWARIIRVLLRLTLLAVVLVGAGGFAAWQFYGDDVSRVACEWIAVGCPTASPALTPQGGNR